MNAREYKNFKAQVTEAKADDWVWWEGYLWISLTERQQRGIAEALQANETVTDLGNNKYKLPSGAQITLKI